MTRAAGEARREPPSPRVLLAVLLTVIAGLGEWKVVNSALGALPKAVSLGVPALAAAAFLVRPDMARMRRCRSVLPVYLLYIAVLLMWSLGVWMHDLTQTASIVRGVSKLLYQCAAILFAVGFVYLCGERAADALFAAMALTVCRSSFAVSRRLADSIFRFSISASRALIFSKLSASS